MFDKFGARRVLIVGLERRGRCELASVEIPEKDGGDCAPLGRSDRNSDFCNLEVEIVIGVGE